MPLSETEFRRQLNACRTSYLTEDAWGIAETNSIYWDIRVTAAYRIYRQAAHPQRDHVLLGETQIRREELLLKNFGFLSDSIGRQGAQEEVAAARAKTRLKQEIRRVPAVDQRCRLPNAVVRGKGAVLASMKWTPFLNDALILGGASAGVSFLLAMPEGNQTWANIRVRYQEQMAAINQQRQPATGNQRGPLTAAASRQTMQTAKRMWLEYFNLEQEMLWDGFPRVLARELLGLELCGYRPVFSQHQLEFRRPNAHPATRFRGYLDHLRASGYRNPNSSGRDTLQARISSFLFDDPNALDPWGYRLRPRF